ncbi:hypothetical protein GCM10011390_49790 [Aureimonas endophytica]|uniref:Dolichyl-phosphate-mannose-protein mannosyltransferase n=1 Tax=Aureimonas endophytica TaxID=2027858 RepID=A0A917A5D4_9HYPH|nr:hypothetical protein [Aureimonas endophytica]GGE24414.1 hypothetical protein GCM10011390_49790 [Aureimonas endophytica]
MFVYLAGELRGLLAWHVLPAFVFGIPRSLIDHGMTLLYETPGHVGWDGQFYYYIANDLKLSPDTIPHIDALTYRYQRIGLALTANLVAMLTLHSWVTPLTYWGTNVLLVAGGTFALASILKKLSLPAPLALLWSLGAGVQVTVLNGLPDAAADAFFLMALSCLMNDRRVAYALAATMAILSREAFAVAAGGLFLLEIVRLWSDQSATKRLWVSRLAVMALPGVVLVAWQLSIYFRFGHFPSQEPGVAGGLVNLPFSGWWQTVSGTFFGNHIFFGSHVPWTEYWLEPLHGVLLVFAIIACVALLRSRSASMAQKQIAVALLPFALLSTTLGPVVTGHWSGYLKATTILILPLIAFSAERSLRVKLTCTLALAVYTVIQQGALWERIAPDAPASAGQFGSTESVVNKPGKDFPAVLACLGDYRSQLSLRGIENFDQRPVFRLLLGRPLRYRLDVDVTNITDKPWQYAQGVGAVALIGRWVRPGTNEEIGQSRRAIIGNDLKPGETRRLSLVVDIPPYAKSSDFVITLIQDGCAWFSDAQDPGVIRMKLQ